MTTRSPNINTENNFQSFVLNKQSIDEENLAEKVKSELIQMVRKDVGAVAAFKMAIAVKDIPRTRSGKTPRKVLADLVSGREFMVSKFFLFNYFLKIPAKKNFFTHNLVFHQLLSKKM